MSVVERDLTLRVALAMLAGIFIGAMVFAFAPIVAFLLGVTDIAVPWKTLVLSVVLFVALPLAAGLWTRAQPGSPVRIAALRVPHRIAAPCALIGTSNFFGRAVAVAISLFGLYSGAALATAVGVLVEVPAMRSLVAFANSTPAGFA